MILVLDTATSTPVIALAANDGALKGERRWQSHHRHGEELLQRLDELLTEAGVSRGELTGVVVGTGPGSFTGLRIGLATAKTIAYALSIPLVGVSSTLALASAVAAAAGEGTDVVNITLPAGASDRYTHRFKVSDEVARESGPPKLVAGEAVAPDHVAVDLDGAPATAKERGQQALGGLAAALARIGSARIAAGETDDIEALVPAYVALPRGIARAAAEMEWSPDLR